MKIVIVGAGMVGHAIAVRLSEENHDITIIDNDDEQVEYAAQSADVMAVPGNGSDYRVLIASGMNEADIVIAVTNNDAVNMLCCLTAKKLGVKYAVARVRTMEYFSQMIFLKDELGLSLAINPEQETATAISRILRFPSVANVNSFAKGRAEMIEYKVTPDSALNNLPLNKLNKRHNSPRILICAVEDCANVIIPKGDFVLKAGQTVHAVAAPDQMDSFFKEWGIYKRSVKNVMILGGGRIALYLGTALLDAGIRVKIIEKDPEHCTIIKEILPKADVLLGDGTNPQLLQEEGIGTTDAFVALTGSDQGNIITSMYAKSCGVEKVITHIKEEHFLKMVDSDKLGSVVSPKIVAAEAVSNYVRAIENSFALTDILALHKMSNDKAESLEFTINPSCKFIGIPFKSLSVRNDAIIGAIIRGEHCIIPGGDDFVQEGDTVIAVTTRHGIQRFDSLLEE